jgi:hypothetical protein
VGDVLLHVLLHHDAAGDNPVCQFSFLISTQGCFSVF